jgi:hypothetical protein
MVQAIHRCCGMAKVGRGLIHRVTVYLGLKEDPELRRDWDRSPPDTPVLVVVWALPALGLVLAVAALLAFMLATSSVLRLLSAMFIVMLIIGLARPWVSAAVRALRRRKSP